VTIEDLSELYEYAVSNEAAFLAAVDKARLFFPPEGTGDESVREAVSLYRTVRGRWRTDEYNRRYERVSDGALVAMPPDYSLPAMEVVRSLIRKKSRNLRLLGVPVLGMCADLLIGAGCVAEVETSAVSLGEAGLAPRFTEAAEKGLLKIRDATCPAIHTALQATEKGVPFMPLRGVLGSDLTRERKDWKVLQNPFSGAEDPILFVPSIAPDIALFHARWADEAGNVWIGRRRELATIAHAAKAHVEILEGEDPVDAIMTLARERGITQIFVGHSARQSWWHSLTGTPLDRLIRSANDIDVRVFPH